MLFVLMFMLVIILRRRRLRRLNNQNEATRVCVKNIFRGEHCKGNPIISFKSFGLVTENCTSGELIRLKVLSIC